jgi:nascent polypeptide-associated complex subunit beta
MSEEVSKEILEARKKFAEKFGGETQIGGKGTQRRKHPVKHRAGKVEVDKKIESVAKKAQARKLNEITEVNIFKDDNTVIQFKKPTIEYSFKEKVSFVSGIHETKNLKEVFTSLLKQLGPKQLAFVKETSEALKSKDKEKIDEAPELVEDFDAVAKGEGKEKEKKKKKKAKKEDKDKKNEEKKEEAKPESDKPAEGDKPAESDKKEEDAK